MTAALAAGWAVAIACAVAAASMRRRLARVADAEHELRGALTAFGLGVDRFARTAAGRRLALTLESELARARAALAELAGAPGEPSPPALLERLVRSAAGAWAPAVADGGIDVEWAAGRPLLTAAPGTVAQALGNLVSNAAEHGDGPVRVRASRSASGVRVEVSNRARPATGYGRRGRGLRIAGRAARAAGGRLTVSAAPDGVTAALELPVER